MILEAQYPSSPSQHLPSPLEGRNPPARNSIECRAEHSIIRQAPCPMPVEIPRLTPEESVWEPSPGCRSGSGFSFEKLRDVAELVIAGQEQFGSGDLLELGIVLFQANIQQIRRRFIVFVRAALGFGHTGVDASQLDQILGGNTHGLRGELALFGVPP